MSPDNAPQPAWPDPVAALDDTLDWEGVMAATGCVGDDLRDLARIFVEESGNMVARLEAAQAMLERHEPDAAQWPQATTALRDAAHELTTSFGIIGARRAEAFAKSTQVHLRPSAGSFSPIQRDAVAVRTAGRALVGAVRRVAELLQAG